MVCKSGHDNPDPVAAPSVGGSWASSATPKNPQPDVTSNLALPPKSAHDGQGGGGKSSQSHAGHKPFVLKILTSKFFDIKILRALFANR
jgi:hypothetical protein